MPTGRQGRPPEGGPPARFVRTGTFADDSSWIVSEEDDPGEVAAAYAQQQLVAAVRRRVGKNVTAADVARALGRTRLDRTVPDVWAGRRAISMRMWLAIALAYDLDPLGYCDRDDRRTLLPAAHRTWLGAWRPGDGMPRFRAPFGPDGEPAWIAAAQCLSAWLDEEDEAGRLRLADNRVAVHAVVEALADAGLPVDLVTDLPPGSIRPRLIYETEPPIELTVHLIPDTPSVDQQRLREVVEDMYRLGYSSRGRALAVILAARRSMLRFEAFIPGCTNAVTVGDSVRIAASAIQHLRRPDDDLMPDELALTTMATHFAANGFVVVLYDLHKDGQVA